MIAVSSSDLRAVGYDEWTGTLVIEFRSGGVYEYRRVPYSEYARLMNASSHGKYFHAYIKNRYPCSRVS